MRNIIWCLFIWVYISRCVISNWRLVSYYFRRVRRYMSDIWWVKFNIRWYRSYHIRWHWSDNAGWLSININKVRVNYWGRNWFLYEFRLTVYIRLLLLMIYYSRMLLFYKILFDERIMILFDERIMILFDERTMILFDERMIFFY